MNMHPNDRPHVAKRHDTSEVAEVTPIQEPFRQRVRGPRYKLWVNLLDLIPAVFFFGGGAVLAGSLWAIYEGATPYLWFAVVGGAISAAWGAYSGTLCMCVHSNRWIERRLRAEISERPEALMDAFDPESVYVSLIPRESFSEVRWTFASDLLLLKFDHSKGRLLLEGDMDRYRIPAGAIARCERKSFSFPMAPGIEIWVVRLVVFFPDATKELLLTVDPTTFRPITDGRRFQIADDMCRRINRFRDDNSK